MYSPGWHGTEVNEYGVTHFTDIVSAYPECTVRENLDADTARNADWNYYASTYTD